MGLKTPYLGIFEMQFWKVIVIFEISTLEFVKMQSLINLGPKMSYLRISQLELEKTIIILEVCILEFFEMQKLVKIKETSNLVPKIRIFGRNFEKLLPYLKKAPSNLWKYKVLGKNKNVGIWDQKCLIWVFSGCNLKNNWNIRNHHTESSSNFRAKMKSLKFGTKNDLFECVLGCNFEKLLSYLKSAPSTLSKCQV